FRRGVGGRVGGGRRGHAELERRREAPLRERQASRRERVGAARAAIGAGGERDGERRRQPAQECAAHCALITARHRRPRERGCRAARAPRAATTEAAHSIAPYAFCAAAPPAARTSPIASASAIRNSETTDACTALTVQWRLGGGFC